MISVIDTHCHLDSEEYFEDFDEVIKRASDNSVGAFIIPGAHIGTLPRAMELVEKYDNIYFAVGVHPYDLDTYDEKILEKYIKHEKCVAVGECGLDYFRLPEDDKQKQEEIKKQKEVFISQINLAKKYKKPLILHIREATNDSKQIILEHNASEVGGVLHCFNASEHLLPLADKGFYFGIGGVVTFKNAKKLVEILPKIPKDKIIVETDCPYLTPHPHRGKRNEPCCTSFVVEKISQLLNMEISEVQSLTTNNAKRIFGI